MAPSLAVLNRQLLFQGFTLFVMFFFLNFTFSSEIGKGCDETFPSHCNHAVPMGHHEQVPVLSWELSFLLCCIIRNFVKYFNG